MAAPRLMVLLLNGAFCSLSTAHTTGTQLRTLLIPNGSRETCG